MSRIQLRHDTATNWTAANPILAAGEKGIEVDTGLEKNGNGTTTWNLLAYVGASGSVPDATTTTKGKLQLAGDLAGTAASPTVPGLAGKASTTHTHAESDVTSLVSDLAAKAASTHSHATTDITSGTLATARLGSGSASSSTFLRGDQTWAAPSGGTDEDTWTPASISSSTMKLWLKPETLPGSGNISSWTDSSGNSNALTQATSGNQPVIATGCNSFNCARFDGVDDYAATTAYTCTTPETIYLLMKLRTSVNGAIPLLAVSGPVRVLRESSAATISLIYAYGWEGILYVAVGTSFFRLIIAKFNPPGSVMHLDNGMTWTAGSVLGPAQPGGPPASASAGIGLGGNGPGANSSAIDVQEVIHLQGLPDPSINHLIVGYIGKKYQLW